jgi:hypothetical protein
MKTKINYDSLANQTIKSKLVEREVWLGMNEWMEDYRQKNEDWFEEFENQQVYICPECHDHMDVSYHGS